MARKVEGSSSNVHGHEEVKNPPKNSVYKIFQGMIAGIGTALFFAYNFVGSLCGRVITCLNGVLFRGAKKDKTPQEKTGEKTDRAAFEVLSKKTRSLIKEASKKVPDSGEDEQESVEERRFETSEQEKEEDPVAFEVLERERPSEEQASGSEKSDGFSKGMSLDKSEELLLSKLFELSDLTEEKPSGSSSEKSESENQDEKLPIEPPVREAHTSNLDNIEKLIKSSSEEKEPEEKSSPSMSRPTGLIIEIPSSLGESSCPQKNTMEKMYNNAQEAFSLHLEKCESAEEAVFFNALPSLETFMNPAKNSPLKFEHNAVGSIGKRKTMEDAHIYSELPSGLLSGVLDGHGGADVANFAAERFSQLFEEVFSEQGKDVYKTFQALIQRIEKEVESNEDWNEQGTVGALSFVDPSTRLIYTAIFGDCGATVYRQVDGRLKAIPLACIRDWKSPKDAERVAKAWNDPDLAEEYMNFKFNEKQFLRYPPFQSGVNVSRAIGDVDCKKNKKNPEAPDAISIKSKISVHLLEPDDVVILGCDGLHDYVRQDQIVEVLSEGPFETAASRLVAKAINDCKSTDNVTVLALRVK